MDIFPNKIVCIKMNEFNTRFNLSEYINNRYSLLKWVYGIEKIIDNKCLDYEKRLKITQKYIASCKGNKGEKPTCRIEKYITNG